MENSKKSSPVVHFEVLGRDAAALQRFYSEAFGWSLGPSTGPQEYRMAGVKHDGGIDGGIGKSLRGAGHATFYVGVDSVQASLDEVRRLGGTVVQELTKIPQGVTYALFADPEGHVVGLVQD